MAAEIWASQKRFWPGRAAYTEIFPARSLVRNNRTDPGTRMPHLEPSPTAGDKVRPAAPAAPPPHLWSRPRRCRPRRRSRWRAGRAGSAAAPAATWTRPRSASPSCPGPACGTAYPGGGSRPGRLANRGSRVVKPSLARACGQRVALRLGEPNTSSLSTVETHTICLECTQLWCCENNRKKHVCEKMMMMMMIILPTSQFWANWAKITELFSKTCSKPIIFMCSLKNSLITGEVVPM